MLQDFGIMEPGDVWMKNVLELGSAIRQQVVDENGAAYWVRPFVHHLARHSPVRSDLHAMAMLVARYGALALLSRRAIMEWEQAESMRVVADPASGA